MSVRNNLYGSEHSIPPEKDKGLGRMVFISALLHVFIIGGIVAGMAWQGPQVSAPSSYTVELVDPAAVGGSLSPGPIKPSAPPPKEPEVRPSPPPRKKVESPKKLVEPAKKTKPKEVKAKPASKPSKADSPPKLTKKTPSSTPPVKKKKAKKAEPKKVKLAKTKEVKREPVPKSAEAEPPPKPARKTFQSPAKKLSAKEVDKHYEAAITRAKQQVRRSTLPSPSRPGPSAVEREGPDGGSVVRRFEFLVYSDQLQNRVKESWIVAERKPGLSAVVRFGVQANGEIFDIELIKSSGDKVFDQSTLRAVNKANPLPPPPPAYQQEFAVQKVEVTFGAAERLD